MNRGDFLWAAVIVVIAIALIVPATHNAFMDATRTHPYLMGFAKFAVLATLGELLGLRIRIGQWKQPVGLLQRIIVWGILGASLVLIFQIFSGGVLSAIAAGVLPPAPEAGKKIAVALWISVIMNVTFAPTMMAAHRITDTYIENRASLKKPVRFGDVIAITDWQSFFTFVVAKSIPFFWIPAHTITFLLPPEYRVLMAAFLSIALGGILGFAARGQASVKSVTATA